MEDRTDDPTDLTVSLTRPLPGPEKLVYEPRHMKLPFANWFKKPSGPEKQLLVMCRGDEEQMERLIRVETARNPARTREFASQAAIERWVRSL